MLAGGKSVAATGDDIAVVAAGVTLSELDPAAGLDLAASIVAATSDEEFCECRFTAESTDSGSITHVPCWSLPRKGTIVCHVPSSFRTCIVGTLIDFTTVVALAFAFVTALFATAVALGAALDFTAVLTDRAATQLAHTQSHLTGRIASRHPGQGIPS